MITLILLCQLMNTWTYRPLVPGVASLTFGIAALPQSILDASLLLVNTYVTAGTAQVALGLLLYGVARATNVSEKAQEISRVLVNQNKQDHLAEISREDQG